MSVLTLGPAKYWACSENPGPGRAPLPHLFYVSFHQTEKIQQGSILFEGRDILQADLRALESIRGKRIALINQEPSAALHPTMRIGDQVGEVLAAHQYLSKRARREKGYSRLSQPCFRQNRKNFILVSTSIERRPAAARANRTSDRLWAVPGRRG